MEVLQKRYLLLLWLLLSQGSLYTIVFPTSCSVSLYLHGRPDPFNFFCTRLWPNFCRVKHEAEGATMSGLTSVLRSSSSGGI